MSSLVERLRVRSDRRPIYNLDDSDDEDFKKKPGQEGTSEKFERPDMKEGSCQICGDGEDLLSCETCTYSYHPKCLLPPLRDPLPTSWKCPECVGPLNEIDKILDCEMRPTLAEESDSSKSGTSQVLAKQYLVKWKGLSYIHCTWVPEKEFIRAYKWNSRLRTKVNNFHRQVSSNNADDEYIPIRPDWTTVDRVIACRVVEEQTEYLVKWKELSYDECSWELESDIASFQKEIERYNQIQSRHGKISGAKQKGDLYEATESKKKLKDFQHYESSPEFLSGGSLHPYQLEGLNFLRFAWSKQTHVILADEMGLGKTIQSIAFLASHFEENVAPHLVVAPLSTLRNWEREFATWAPHMNVVMYVGVAQARAVIREHEFYYPKSQIKNKKKKSGQAVYESKQDRIKFDVLLTSYEMINLDTLSLKPIKWECMIVDEGHRLKNKDSKLFSSLKQYSSRHRVLLTGTPLQNNLDELFMLMHFLDAGKFASLEEFQEEFKDINQEEQISRLHKMLAPHLLRRVKKDVMKDMPPKKELILRVELSSKQKEYYKAILTRNYQLLTRKGGAQISLINVVMELRKLCCHPFMLEGVEPEDTNEFYKQLLISSGKMELLDKMMVRLKEQGHRVLIYTQFQHMLDLLEDYCNSKKWNYERIDGKVSGAERQIRIDRFNAKNSSRFCFLLSTRAGGLGINLATADTVIIYDSDWNPHADLQAMARAHRLGQINKVMIYRLITRGTIEERMMEMTKKKMILEHLVVGKLKTQNINQEELDDIIRYGSKELFADDTDELVKSRQIHYDDTAIDRLLDREKVGDEDASMDEEEESGFLKAFKVANFEYVDEAEVVAEEELPEAPVDNKASANNPERANFWEDLLRDKYEMQKVEEFNAMGKGKRSRKQMVSVEEDDLAGMQDVSSDGEDDNYEVELTDNETAPTGAATARRNYRRKARDISDIPLMEGEGRSFRVLGFNQSQRALFVQIMMRFGTGEYDWADFAPRLKQKTLPEIHNYGRLFLDHISQDIIEGNTFSDGVPKEGLRSEDVLLRIASLSCVRSKLKTLSEGASPLFGHDILYRFPGLKGGRVWKEHHDRLLLTGVLKHGYGRWQAILDDKSLKVQEVICRELNLQCISMPAPGVPQAQTSAAGAIPTPQFIGAFEAQTSASRIFQTPGPTEVFSQSQNGVLTGPAEAHAIGASGADVAPARAQLFQDQSTLTSFRESQRRQVEFIKKRVQLLEKALHTEDFLKGCSVEDQKKYMPSVDTEHKVSDVKIQTNEASDEQMDDMLPPVDTISREEIMISACDGKPDRLNLPMLYNKMCNVVTDNTTDSVEAYLASRAPSSDTRKHFSMLEAFSGEVSKILSQSVGKKQSADMDITMESNSKSTVESSLPNVTGDVEMEDKSAPGVILLD